MFATTADECRLLDAIFDRYDDPAPRLAWADHLDAQGNPWGAVVRTALAAAQRGKKLTATAVAAEAANAALGLGPLATCTSRFGARFDRGTLAASAIGAHIWNYDVMKYGGEPPYFANHAAAWSHDDPRWRGVSWLHNMAAEGMLGLVREARLERLTQLSNVPVRAAGAMATLPLASQLTALSVYQYDADAGVLTSSLLDAFPSLTRFALSDLRSGRTGNEPSDLRWLAESAVARTRLRRIEGMELGDLAALVALLPTLASVEAVRFSAAELTRTKAGVMLSFSRFGPWVEARLKAVAPGVIGTLAVDEKALATGKTNRARHAALAQRLGAVAAVTSRAEVRAREAARGWGQ